MSVSLSFKSSALINEHPKVFPCSVWKRKTDDTLTAKEGAELDIMFWLFFFSDFVVKQAICGIFIY